MKVAIQDRRALGSVLPLDVATYLRTHGWQETSREYPRFSLWHKQDERDRFEVLLPLSRDFQDYPLRIAELLSNLEIVEQRSQLEIFQDITTTSADVIRVRSEHAQLDDGSLPLEGGVALVKNTRDLLLAAACATVMPRTYFPTRKPDEALRYLERLRLGQTERGSYVVTIHSPVPPDLHGSQIDDEAPDTDPFERRVTKTLMRALAAVQEAAEQSAATGSIQPFEKAMSAGVSVNLCDALANLQEETGADALEIGVSWAPVRAMQEKAILSRVTLSRDAIPVMKEASRVFKRVAPQEEVSVRGFITDLHRGDSLEGTILIAGVIDGLLRKVRATLSPADYDLAISAHQSKAPVRCEGDLVREGKGYTLRNPRGFTVESGEE